MSSTIFFFLFIPLLAFILLSVNLIFAPHNPYMEKNSAFECGFSSFLGQNRTQFSISFFVFALLFLLFDLEILLVYPYLVSAYTNGVYGLVIMLMFLLALTLGFAFELGKKALSIDSRQMSNVATLKKSNYVNKVNAAICPLINIKKRSYSTSNNKVNFEVVFYIVKFIWFLYSLAKLIINLFRAPVSFIYNYIWNQIVGVITYSLESSYHYRVLKSIYYEYEFTYSLILSALFIRHSYLSFLNNKHNILNILCFYLACLYGVYNINFFIFFFFLLSSIAILLVLSIITNLTIIYIDKPKGLNLLLAYLCFGVLVLLLGVVLFYLDQGYLKYVLCILYDPNKGPSGPSGPEGPQGSSGPGGPGGPGKPPGNSSSVISSDNSRKKRGKEKREKEIGEKEKEKPKHYDEAGWHEGETKPLHIEFQEKVFNKEIYPINTGEDTNFKNTSTADKQQAMDEQYKKSWENYEADGYGGFVKTLDNSQNIESVDNPQNIESVDNPQNIESIDKDFEADWAQSEAAGNPQNKESVDNPQNIEWVDNPQSIEAMLKEKRNAEKRKWKHNNRDKVRASDAEYKEKKKAEKLQKTQVYDIINNNN